MTIHQIQHSILCVFTLFEHKCILTGSCADYYNIGYSNIEDIDILIELNDYHELISKNYDQYKEDIILIYALRHKEDNHMLFEYLINGIKLHILAKHKKDLELEIIQKPVANQLVSICSPRTRYDQLLCHSKHFRKSRPDYLQTMEKVFERITIYEKFLNILKNNTD